MIFIKINNKLFFVKKDISILEACKFVGIIIPRFCYHEALSIAGNCRMCLVEIEPNTNLKPVSACTLTVAEDIHILTDSPFVKKARENVLESLLLNHPLDCPICDQGGECDLQDQTVVFGIKSSRYTFKKRAVEDKKFGGFIKTIMIRCIHCTRCVRFSDEIVGTKYLGTLSRGEGTEIGTYINHIFKSNISGNLIDLCPVGALTSKLYAFQARPWELETVETIDLTDSCGTNIYVNTKEAQIVRVLPKKKNQLNGFFISDKTRFSYDAVFTLRVTNIFFKKIKLTKMLSWECTNWTTLITQLKSQIGKNVNLFIIPEDLDYQLLGTLFHLQQTSKHKIAIRTVEINYSSNNIYNNNWIFNNSFSSLNSLCCFLISSNLKIENVLLNIKLREKKVKSLIDIYSTGFNNSNIFSSVFITFNKNSFFKIFEGKHFFSKTFLLSTQLCFIFGNSIKANFLHLELIYFIKKKLPTSIFISLLKSANSAACSFLNIKSINSNLIQKSSNYFALCLEDNLFLHKIFLTINWQTKTIYWLNSFSSFITKRVHWIIPILTSFELDGIYINFEGKAQCAYKSIVNLNRDIISGTAFINIFKTVFANLIFQFAAFTVFIEMTNRFIDLDTTVLNSYRIDNSTFFFKKYMFKPALEDFYQTNAFTKNSLNMHKRSKEIRKVASNFSLN